MPTQSPIQRLSASSQQLLAQSWMGHTTTSASSTQPIADPSPAVTPAPSTPPELSDAEKLQLLDESITEAELYAPPQEPVAAQQQVQADALASVHSALLAETTPPQEAQSVDVQTDEHSDLISPETSDQIEPALIPTSGSEPAAGLADDQNDDQTDVALLSQALPQATNQAWQDSQQTVGQSGTISKERSSGSWSLDGALQEAGGSIAAVEEEKVPEIAPEVEEYLERVEDHQATPAKTLEEMVPTVVATPPATAQQTVRVLPVTKAQDQAGMKKSPKYGLRWLVEWSHKLIKMFNGKVVYRSAETSA